MLVQPYLFFDGRCEEALDFYRQALAAQVDMVMRYRESPEAPPPGVIPPGSGDKIMHASFRIGDTVLMASDGACSGDPVFHGVTLSIGVQDVAEAQRIFAALSEAGDVQMPLGETFWSPAFGMVSDRFGVSWMVNVAAPEPGPA